MKRKRLFKIIGLVFGLLIFSFTCFIGFKYFSFKKAHNTEGKEYKHYIGYINQDAALLNDINTLCNKGAIYHTYSSAGAKAFVGSKKQFRDNILSEYKNEKYSDSGYLNFRFLVNCEGKAGWFEIIEMNLDLEESSLNKEMVNQLFKLTSNSKHWNILNYKEANQNYYMYISYRIEHGEITEILP
jgi:hypothetical protein